MPGLRGDFVEACRKDMYKFEREGLMEEETMYDKVWKVVKGATGAGTKDTQKLRADGLTRHTAEGQNIIFRSPKQGWTTYVKYHTYSDGLTFSPEAIEDTVKLKDMLTDYSKTWGIEERVSKETLGARPFNEGGNLLGDFIFNGSYTGEADPSGDLVYDSKPLFNLTGNARTTKGGQTYYNSVADAYPSSGDVLPSHIKTLYNLMTATNNRDEQGAVVRNKPDTILTKAGNDEISVWEICNSDQKAASALNDKNVWRGKFKNLYAWDYLTEDAIFMGKARAESCQFHERLASNIRFFRHEDTAGYKASIRVRFGVYLKVGCWRDWVRGGGTSA